MSSIHLPQVAVPDDTEMTQRKAKRRATKTADGVAFDGCDYMLVVDENDKCIKEAMGDGTRYPNAVLLRRFVSPLLCDDLTGAAFDPVKHNIVVYAHVRRNQSMLMSALTAVPKWIASHVGDRKVQPNRPRDQRAIQLRIECEGVAEHVQRHLHGHLGPHMHNEIEDCVSVDVECDGNTTVVASMALAIKQHTPRVVLVNDRDDGAMVPYTEVVQLVEAVRPHPCVFAVSMGMLPAPRGPTNSYVYVAAVDPIAGSPSVIRALRLLCRREDAIVLTVSYHLPDAGTAFSSNDSEWADHVRHNRHVAIQTGDRLKAELEKRCKQVVAVITDEGVLPSVKTACAKYQGDFAVIGAGQPHRLSRMVKNPTYVDLIRSKCAPVIMVSSL